MGETQSKPRTTIDSKGNVTQEFEWIIPNFLTLDYGVGYCLKKDIVPSVPEKYWFSLQLYPNGFNERTKNYVSVWLKKHTSKEMTIRFTCAIVDGKGKHWCKKSVKQNLALESVLGWTILCPRDVLMDDKNEILKEGSMILRGKVKIYTSSEIPNAEIEDDPLHNKSLSEMSDNLHQLLTDGQFTDIKLKVGRETLHVHKAVLSARSPVFKAMCKSALHENLKEIDIKDISYEAMEIVLKYIYSGKLDHLNVPIATEVYYAADKYEVCFLKNICSTILSKSLQTDIVIDVLLLAHRHSDFELEESCLNYMDKNLREIKGRPKWIELMSNFPTLADKALFFEERKYTSS